MCWAAFFQIFLGKGKHELDVARMWLAPAHMADVAWALSCLCSVLGTVYVLHFQSITHLTG